MAKDPERVCVLVVDDEPRIRESLRRVLDPMGYCVRTAADGQAALAVLDREPVAIVLLDLQLPDMHGMAILHRIRERYPHIVVIIITGFSTVQTAAEAMRSGAYDLLPKPFDPAQLRLAINRAREKMALEAEARHLQQEKLRTLADLSLEQSRLRAILDTLPIGVLVTDNQGGVVLFNPTFASFMELPADTPPGRELARYVRDDGLRSRIAALSGGCATDGEEGTAYELCTGGETFLLARGRPVVGEQGQCLGAVVTLVDITAMKVLDRLRGEFVAKVSHELRSPLSTIHEQLAMLLSDLVGQLSPSDAHLLSRAKEKTQGLIALIGDLLDLSRIESGVVCRTPTAVQVEELLENIIVFLNTKAAAKQQTIALRRASSLLPAIQADPLALESIFGNLITNAVNYSPAGTTIEVTVQRVDTQVQIAVRDEGFGIEARHLGKIFERFYRVKTEKTRYITGTGLGLPIVKGLVDALGGRITVESIPDKGSTFAVLLPLPEADL
ncbi:ATP-binding response regulator [Desulfatitalea alkaliphila]|uniref:histidine kinase n=1 Tax=Desulfatitalea alkaliphila TaxID=2929485 RepID=A0AA41UH60_9BACT|nr:response regulator [Desulfatitalea alkaliphila]MCJ8499275.1 response regulator [Desulfatitalea alkaliphila]